MAYLLRLTLACSRVEASHGLRLENPAGFRQPFHRICSPQKPPFNRQRESRTGRRRLFAIIGPPHRLLREINRSPSRVKKSVENLAQYLRGRGVRRLFSSGSFSLLFAFSSCSSLHFCGCYKKQSFITALMGCGFRCIKSVATDVVYEAKNNKNFQHIRMSRGCHVYVTRSK